MKTHHAYDSVKQIVVLVLLVFGIRSFVVEPFKIPSGSMIPTLLIGDYVLVSKSSYGVRLPFTGTQLVPTGKPKRGDVIVFRFPDNPSQDFIKRVVGLPGDRVEVIDDVVYLNQKPIDRQTAGEFSYTDHVRGRVVHTNCIHETSEDGLDYRVIYEPGSRARGRRSPWIVPDASYFMMGDNRDNSRDSRMWKNSFVHEDQIKGRAFRIHWSWVVDSSATQYRGFIQDLVHTLVRLVTFQIEEVRWDRIGRSIWTLPDCGTSAGEAN